MVKAVDCKSTGKPSSVRIRPTSITNPANCIKRMPIYVLLPLPAITFKVEGFRSLLKAAWRLLKGCSFFVEGKHLSIQNKNQLRL